ncbi:MAG: hypothetical protein N838_01020 [Thiohalocapsa sp. PB-PSB1]|nr:MAG: hypothetical protein N838_29105 [Thiohalocapsa sp. PB-PSB1]QQO52170.1 MAG: hypothetical protein N838_01020 [Thiohalocapsa sp. PB-PSB1]
MKDWLPIVVSILALLFSVYATYIKDLKKKSSLKYYESWDIHAPPTPSEISISETGSLVKEIFEKTLRKAKTWLIYTITITNVGNKDSESLKMGINNLDDVSIKRGNNQLLISKAYLFWEPLTHEKPEFEKGVLTIGSITPGSTVRLTIYKRIGWFTGKKVVTIDDIPYISTIDYSAGMVRNINEPPFHDGSIKALQQKLQKQYSEIVGNP